MNISDIEDADMECDGWFDELEKASPEKKRRMLQAEDEKNEMN